MAAAAMKTPRRQVSLCCGLPQGGRVAHVSCRSPWHPGAACVFASAKLACCLPPANTHVIIFFADGSDGGASAQGHGGSARQGGGSSTEDESSSEEDSDSSEEDSSEEESSSGSEHSKS